MALPKALEIRGHGHEGHAFVSSRRDWLRLWSTAKSSIPVETSEDVAVDTCQRIAVAQPPRGMTNAPLSQGRISFGREGPLGVLRLAPLERLFVSGPAGQRVRAPAGDVGPTDGACPRLMR